MEFEVKPITFDNFLEEELYDELRDVADWAKFRDTLSPIDNVIYPALFLDIPEHIKEAILARLRELMGDIYDPVMFLRKSMRGVSVPHQVHSDLSMGDMSLFLYLNREEHCQGGTGLVSHVVTGLKVHPRDEGELMLLQEDMHFEDMWYTHTLLEMHPNRGAIMPAHYLHRAEPVGGFGESNYDARIVLICFFKVAYD